MKHNKILRALMIIPLSPLFVLMFVFAGIELAAIAVFEFRLSACISDLITDILDRLLPYKRMNKI